jgi:hypothetical protein
VAESRVEELRRRIERDPGSRLFAQLAEQLRKDGELEEAIRVARGGLEKHPDYPSARLTLGHALLDAGDPAAARDELDKAFKGAPDNILASRLLGEALETLGDLEAAVSQFRRTLDMAPGDRHVQARIQSIQERLAAPGGEGAPVRGAPTPPEDPGVVSRAAPPQAGTGGASPSPKPPPDHTKPMQAVKREEAPPRAVGPPPEPPEPEEGGLPPTIRIRMPGDPVGGIPPPTSRPPAAATPPRVEKPGAGEEAAAAETTLPDRRERNADALPATLPGGRGHAEKTKPGPGEPAPGGLAESAGPPSGEGGAEGRAQADDVKGGGDTDLAPTLPSSRAAEYAAMDAAPPPPGSPGEVTTPDGGASGARPTEPPATPREEEPPPARAPAPPTSEPRPASAKPPPPEAARAEPEPSAAERRPLPASAPPDAQPTQGTEAAGQPLSSGTLAELYFQQGLVEQAVEVYRDVLAAEPGNEAARARLAELEAAGGTGGPSAAADEGDERAARRRVLERTIERLEALLAIVQGR